MIKFVTSIILNLLVCVLIVLFLAGSFAAAIFFNPELTRKAVEFAANQATKPYLSESIRVGSAHVDSRARIFIEDLSASIQTAQGPIKFRVGKINSEASVINFFKPDGLKLLFDGAMFDGSKLAGVNGAVTIKGGKDWFVDVSAKVNGIGFEEVVWINPDQLRGTTGNLLGTFEFHAQKNQEPLLDAEIEVRAPGGVMQTQLIRYLFQYLPPVSIKPEVQKMVSERGLIPYSGVRMLTQMETTDRIKVFLFISIPDYNFNLNTNIEIRMDQKNGFGQISKIFGLIKTGHS